MRGLILRRMLAGAFALVLAAAVAHAGWNFFAKRSDGGAAFVFLFNTLALVIYAPVAAVDYAVERPSLGGLELMFMAGSGLLHAAYFLFLQRAYRVGELSLVYPVARGSGLLLATAGGVLVYGERPGAVALAGAALVAVGIFLVSGGSLTTAASDASSALAYAGLAGMTTASYVLWDKYAVDDLAIPPLVYNWGETLFFSVVLLPVAFTRRADLRVDWQRHRKDALAVAVLSPLAYILVLSALSFAPVSYVAPAREVSILIGAALGARLLAEENPRRRLAGAVVIVVGLIALAIR